MSIAAAIIRRRQFPEMLSSRHVTRRLRLHVERKNDTAGEPVETGQLHRIQ